MKYSKQKAFTLVELIVVIVILGILGTIGFVSYSGYLGGARDSNRVSQLKGITDSLNLYNTKNTLPFPDDYVTVTASGTTIGYQGYVGANILELIDYTNGGKDPKDGGYFTYYLSSDKKQFQMLTFLEDTDNLETRILGSAQTHAADLSSRHPKVYGHKLGVLTQDTTNIPIQEVVSLLTARSLDIANTTDIYSAHITDTSNHTGTGGTLVASIWNGSCKRLKEAGKSKGSGLYKISIPGSSSLLKVYCDMTANGGGRTLINSDLLGNDSGSFFSRADTQSQYGIDVSITANAVGCGSPNKTSHKIEIASNMAWTEIWFTQEFEGNAPCWSIFGYDSNGYTTNLVPFALEVNSIADQLKMKTSTEDVFDGDTRRCDNSTSTNFWHGNKGTGLRKATIILNKSAPSSNAGLYTSVACNSIGSTKWSYKNIYVR